MCWSATRWDRLGRSAAALQAIVRLRSAGFGVRRAIVGCMDTPYGTAVDGPYASKQDFYSAYPQAAQGWNWKEHPGTAPLGSDLWGAKGRDGRSEDDDWLLTLCHPSTPLMNSSPVGVLTAFKRATEEIFVLSTNVDWGTVKAEYLP